MTKLNILLVEDSKRLRDLELELLNAHGELEVGAFSDSEGDALALLAASTFDVVILDLKLKSGTGFGVYLGRGANLGDFAVVEHG